MTSFFIIFIMIYVKIEREKIHMNESHINTSFSLVIIIAQCVHYIIYTYIYLIYT